jgi:hypothetical protein
VLPEATTWEAEDRRDALSAANSAAPKVEDSSRLKGCDSLGLVLQIATLRCGTV